MTAEQAIYQCEEYAHAVITNKVKDYGCTTIEELAVKCCRSIKNICDNYKKME